jgi:hypothetical protein
MILSNRHLLVNKKLQAVIGKERTFTKCLKK